MEALISCFEKDPDGIQKVEGLSYREKVEMKKSALNAAIIE
jgi:hypothetical protein